MEPLATLSGNPLFAEFSRDELRELLGHGEVESYRPGERVIRAGEPGSFLGIVLDGSVQAESRQPDGERWQVE